MNERDRYRGAGQQRGSDDRGNSERGERERGNGIRSRDESGDYASRDQIRFGTRGNDPQNEGDAQSTSRSQYDRNPYDQRGFGRDARDSQQSASSQDRAFREHDRDYRGGSSSYGQPRDYPHEAVSYGSGGGLGSARSNTLRGGLGASGSSDLGESPWGNRSDFYRENRGDSTPSYARGQGNGSLSNFGDRTQNEAQYYAGRREGQGHSGRGPKGYARSDERIREDVCEQLSENDEVDASDVEVTVSNREVTLTGTIETRRMKHIAEDIADAVSGVNDVHNNITVRKAFLKEVADRITGDDDDKSQHHAHGGTKNSSTSSFGSSSSAGVNGRA